MTQHATPHNRPTTRVAPRSHRRAPTRALRRRGLVLGTLILGLASVVWAALAPAGAPAEPAPLATLRTADFHSLAFGPDGSDVVFFGHHNGVMRSDDGGRTWRALVEEPNFDAMSLAVSAAAPPRSSAMYLAGHDVFQVSTDRGASWQRVAHDLPGTDIHAFAVSREAPGRLFAFVVGRGLFRSTDGGRAWQPAGGELPGDVMALAAAGGTPETLYAGSMRLGVLRSTDEGRSWSRAATGLGSGRVLALAADPASRRTVYAGLDNGLYKSTDAGATWLGLPFPGGNAVAVAVSPTRPSVVLAVTVRDRQGLVFRSEDGGATWGGRK